MGQNPFFQYIYKVMIDKLFTCIASWENKLRIIKLLLQKKYITYKIYSWLHKINIFEVKD